MSVVEVASTGQGTGTYYVGSWASIGILLEDFPSSKMGMPISYKDGQKRARQPTRTVLGPIGPRWDLVYATAGILGSGRFLTLRGLERGRRT